MRHSNDANVGTLIEGEIGELRSKAEATDEDLTSPLAGPKGL